MITKELNQYGNEAGTHTPIRTAALMRKLKKEFPSIEWVDASWHNDMCDSIITDLPNKKELRIWVPDFENDFKEYAVCCVPMDDVESVKELNARKLATTIENVRLMLNEYGRKLIMRNKFEQGKNIVACYEDISDTSMERVLTIGNKDVKPMETAGLQVGSERDLFTYANHLLRGRYHSFEFKSAN